MRPCGLPTCWLLAFPQGSNCTKPLVQPLVEKGNRTRSLLVSGFYPQLLSYNMLQLTGILLKFLCVKASEIPKFKERLIASSSLLPHSVTRVDFPKAYFLVPKFYLCFCVPHPRLPTPYSRIFFQGSLTVNLLPLPN